MRCDDHNGAAWNMAGNQQQQQGTKRAREGGGGEAGNLMGPDR